MKKFTEKIGYASTLWKFIHILEVQEKSGNASAPWNILIALRRLRREIYP